MSTEIQEPWGISRITYTLDQLLKLAQVFYCNDFRIAATYAVSKTLIWEPGHEEFVLEFIEDLDHIRRSEPLVYMRRIPQSWIDEIYLIVCRKP